MVRESTRKDDGRTILWACPFISNPIGGMCDLLVHLLPSHATMATMGLLTLLLYEPYR